MPEKLIIFMEEAYKAALTKINERMVGKVYIVQDQLTIVDFMFAELIMNSQMIKTPWETDYPNIWSYYQGLLTNVPELKEDSTNVKEVIEMLASN